MKRRILSILIAALLLLPVTTARGASAPVTITSEDVHGSVGDTVSAVINIVVEPPKLGQTMDSLQFVLEYDSTALEFVGIQEVSQDRINIMGVQYLCSVDAKAGAVAFTAAATRGVSGTGVLMHVRFKILSAVSTMLVLKKVSYSFVSSSGTQTQLTGGAINLGRITGQSAPTTVPPASYAPPATQEPSNLATDEPRYPVTEVTIAPGASAEPEQNSGDSDILAYIVFGLFIVVAILICVVLTLMIVRRGQNRSRAKLLEDDEDDLEPYTEEDEDVYDDISSGYEEYDEPFVKEEMEIEEADKPYTKRYTKPQEKDDEPEDDDESPIQIVRRGKK